MILRFLGSNWTGTLACQLLGVTLGEERPGCVELGQAQTLGDLPGWLEFKEKVECEGCECSRQAPDCSALGLSDQGYEMGLKLPSPHRAVEEGGKQATCKVRGMPVTASSSSPQGHPFIVQFNDGNATVVSMWVCRALEERRSQQGPP